jgi:hypothetical protein
MQPKTAKDPLVLAQDGQIDVLEAILHRAASSKGPRVKSKFYQLNPTNRPMFKVQA